MIFPPKEGWIAKLFEPVRKSFFNGPQPPPMQFMMPEKQLPKDAEVALLLGLHQSLGGPFKLVVLFKAFKCLHIYECVSQGRQWWYTLHLSTDTRFTLREMQNSFQPRREPYPKWWQNGAGDAYPRGLAGEVSNDVVGVSAQPQSSVTVHRDASDPRNLSGGVETFVPERLLLGAVPQSLLDDYLFFQDEALEPHSLEPGEGRPGYKKLRGYPKDKKTETVLLVELQPVGSWEEALAGSGSLGDGSLGGGGGGDVQKRSHVIETTCLPGRTLRVLRRVKATVETELKKVKAVAAELERLKLLRRPTKKAAAKAAKAAAKEGPAFSVGDVVEFDVDGSGTKYVSAEVLKCHVDGAFFDLEPSEAWVGRQLRCPLIFMRKPGSSSTKEGEGVWIFDGLTDSEDEDWRDDDANARVGGSGNEDDEAARLRNALPFEFFDRLSYVLQETGFDETICIAILRKLAAVPGAAPFSSVSRLAAAVATEVGAHFKDACSGLAAKKVP